MKFIFTAKLKVLLYIISVHRICMHSKKISYSKLSTFETDFSKLFERCKNVYNCQVFKGPFILLCWTISVECPTNFDPCFMLIGCLGLPLSWLDVSSGKFKFVWHSTVIIRQSEIKRPLKSWVEGNRICKLGSLANSVQSKQY